MTDRAPQRGFTLPEIMVSMTVLGIMSALFLSVYFDMSEIAFASDSKNMINRDIRNVTQQMSRTAREASYFALYRSFDADDRDAAEDQLLEGKTGDFVVFVYLGLPTDATRVNQRPIERIVGYYRAVDDPDDPDALGPVRRFDLEITGNAQSATLESILPVASSSDDYPAVVQLSQGLANGDMFFNLWNQSLMINGKIVHGNAAKRITDTYNFTVSPRGMQQ